MKSTLELVRAGAGSGKTTDLCKTVAEAVAKGLDPARLLATTFTKKAAAELKGRIQTKLLSRDGERIAGNRNAERLELAAIGTVHSVAHQLLSRYAIEMGLSPRLEVMTEEAGIRALGELLGAMPMADRKLLADLAERLGVDDIDQRIRLLLNAKRGNRISDSDFARQMAESAERVCALLAPEGAAAEEAPANRLRELAGEALTEIDKLNDTTGTTDKARQKLRQLKSGQLPLWGSYLEAIRIEAGKRSGANAKLDSLRTHAAGVCREPRLHADVRLFSAQLAQATLRLEADYRRYKSDRGLVDFTDLETLFLELLENDELAARLAEDFDLVMVDEFQDTNPLQLAVFQRLRRIAPRNRWVGDPKQAIYGFRDTDPKLVNDIWDGSPDAERAELPRNFRSQRGLVQLVGALFGSVFGADALQTPDKPGLPRGVERWIFDTKNQAEDAAALAVGIAKLHAEGIRFGDIAVLERTNPQIRTTADGLEKLGIPYLIEHPGLFSTREGAIILAGLRLVADRNDSLAAATVIHLLTDPYQDTPEWIGQRLQTLRSESQEDENVFRKPWEDDPRLGGIEDIDRSLESPSVIVQRVIETLRLPALIARWNDPARRCSNLDSLLRHAREYEEGATESGRAATLTGLILHLERLQEERQDVCFPPLGHDAVTVMTYHSAKGLEWPVVVLDGLNTSRDPDMWSPVVTGGGNADADSLEGRTLRAWVWPFGKTEGEFPRARSGSGLEDRGLASEEGQERAARDRAENLRLLYVGCTRAKSKLVFAHREGNYEWLARLTEIDRTLDWRLGEGEHGLQDIDTTFVVRRLNAGMLEEHQIASLDRERWFAAHEAGDPRDGKPRYSSPSQATAESDTVQVRCEELPSRSYFPSGAGEDRYAPIGDAVHSYLAALPSARNINQHEKERVAERCLAAFGVTGLLPPADVVATGERFQQWVEEKYPEAEWLVETSVIGTRAVGGRWLGTADLLLRLPDGKIVIIDHKSAPIRRNDCGSKAKEFAAQLCGYSEALSSVGERVAGEWIHFALAGVMVELQSLPDPKPRQSQQDA
jgi:ATP-dependent exoDNAse (exonuclease V) beta subunit